MDILARYERSWSIQEALDQHAVLAEQRGVLAEIGANRLRVRQTQLSFSELEVKDTLDAARNMAPAVAGDAKLTLSTANRLRAAVKDLRHAARQHEMERALVSEHLAVADEEIERSRLEMAAMKESIDDKGLQVATDDPPIDNGKPQQYFYCTNCKVGGHGQRFCEYFLQRPNWRVYPQQRWFADEKKNEYHCPLGKKLVNFADESYFSRIAMYLKGRAWLEEKTKVIDIAGRYMPNTYVIEGGVWKDGRTPPPDDEGPGLPWFVKEADRNWGTSVHVCAKPSECLGLAKNKESVYVVQRHIADPLLTDDGRKCHIKFYVLLVGLEDGKQWKLYTFHDGYLSISPNRWNPQDLSKETQVTIIRSERIKGWKPWPSVYPKCQQGVKEIIGRAVSTGKLEGRLGKRQFEILSADFIVDTSGEVWFFEFNMSPVLKDPKDAPDVNDADMINAALHIVAPWEGGSSEGFDLVGEFEGEPPKPKVKPPAAAEDGAPDIAARADGPSSAGAESDAPS